MSSSADALRALAERTSPADLLNTYRERYGRHASREIARRYGVSQRTAQRALRGETRNPKFMRTERARADTAAAAVRGIHVAHAGTVEVAYANRDEGSRSIGDVFLDPADLDEVADWLASEDWDEAGNALDAVILDQYGGLGRTLQISDYTDGLSFD
jgi:hypothetical protein